MNTKKKSQLWNATFIILCLVSLGGAIGQQFLNATMPLYVQSLGETATFSGITATAFSVASAIARPINGRLCDKRGCRGILVGGSALFAFSIGIMIGPINQVIIFICRIFQGVAFSMVVTAAATAVSNNLPSERMTEGISYFGLAQALSMAVGASIALASIGNGNYARAFLTAAVILAICTCLSAVVKLKKIKPDQNQFVEKNTKKSESNDSFLNRYIEKSALLPAGIVFLIMLCASIVAGFFTLYASDSGIETAGNYFTVYAIAMIVSKLLAGKVTEKLGEKIVLMAAIGCGIGAFLLFAYWPVNIMVYPAGILFGFCIGTVQPLLNAVALKKTAENRRGIANATFYLAIDISMAVGASLWGIMVDATGGFVIPYTIAAVILLISIAIVGGMLKTDDASYGRAE